MRRENKNSCQLFSFPGIRVARLLSNSKNDLKKGGKSGRKFGKKKKRRNFWVMVFGRFEVIFLFGFYDSFMRFKVRAFDVRPNYH